MLKTTGHLQIYYTHTPNNFPTGYSGPIHTSLLDKMTTTQGTYNYRILHTKLCIAGENIWLHILGQRKKAVLHCCFSVFTCLLTILCTTQHKSWVGIMYKLGCTSSYCLYFKTYVNVLPWGGKAGFSIIYLPPFHCSCAYCVNSNQLTH